MTVLLLILLSLVAVCNVMSFLTVRSAIKYRRQAEQSWRQAEKSWRQRQAEALLEARSTDAARP